MVLYRLILGFLFPMMVYAHGKTDNHEPTEEDRALALQIEAAREPARGTPGQEALNHLENGWPSHFYEILSGVRAGDEFELERARQICETLRFAIENGPSWPTPPALKAPYSNSPITIDGVIDEAAWQSALVLEEMFLFETESPIQAPKTEWRLLAGESALYVACVCEDTNIIANPVSRDGKVQRGDHVAIYLLGDRTTARYWELAFSPKGAIFDAFHVKALTGWGPKPNPKAAAENMAGLRAGVRQVDGEMPGYMIEVEIPLAELAKLREAPTDGNYFVMLTRADKADASSKRYAFTPLLSWPHNIWNYARLQIANE